MVRVYADRRSKSHRTSSDRVNFICLPQIGRLAGAQHEVNCIKRRIPEAWRRVDCHEAALISSIEDVDGSQVAVKKDRGRGLLREV